MQPALLRPQGILLAAVFFLLGVGSGFAAEKRPLAERLGYQATWTFNPPRRSRNGSKMIGIFASYAVGLKRLPWRCCRRAQIWTKPNQSRS
jgi:hypothetical protein